MLDSVRVAAVTTDSKPGAAAENLRKIDTRCGEAADQGAQLVLLPELSLSGFTPNHPEKAHESWLRAAMWESKQFAEPLAGPSVDTLSQIAARRRLFISAGLLEDAGTLLFNTQVLVGPDGLVGRWRKMHIPMFELPFYNGGDAPRVIDTPLARIGVNICFDAFLPESTRLLAVQNAEIVLFPFAADPPPRTPQGWTAWAGLTIRARCMENAVFGVACNYAGLVELAGARQEFPGGGLIVSPRGDVMAEWPEHGNACAMLVADLAGESLHAARAEPEYSYRFRRPELYGPLVQPLAGATEGDDGPMTGNVHGQSTRDSVAPP